MDNTKIFIDIDDEITFIGDRVLSADTQNVILVIPEKAAILSSLASLRLLKYIIDKSGKKVVVATMDEIGKVLTTRAGFKTFSRIGEISPDIWSEFEEIIPAQAVEQESENISEPEEVIEEAPQDDEEKIESEPTQQEEEIQEPVVENEPESIPEISLKDLKDLNPSIEEVNNMAVEEKPKFVESVRIVKLAGFDLVIGGDAAVVRESKKIERKVISKKKNTIETFHSGQSITGKDVEPNISKKKADNIITKKFMQTTTRLKNIGKKFYKNWMLAPIILIIIACFVLSVIFFPNADIAITLDAQNLSDSSTVTANVNNSSVNSSSKAVPAYYIDVNESSSSSLNTTGTKQVGNQATGSVVIYNLTKTQLTVPKGTVFITNDSNAYQYTLDNDVTITGTVGYPQSQTGSLTAENIGSSYNIPVNTPFTISNSTLSSEVTASSSTAFQGGTSSNAQVVAQADQDNLLKSLEQQLYAKGNSDLNAKLTSDMYVAKDSMKNTDVTKSFDSNVGDKATILNLSLTTKTSVLVYKKEDIQSFSQGVLLQKIGSSYSLNGVSFTQTYKSYDSSSGNVSIDVSSDAKAIASLNKGSIANSIKRKSQSSALMYIKGLSGVIDAKISISPFWYSILGFMPLSEKQIHINLVTK